MISVLRALCVVAALGACKSTPTTPPEGESEEPVDESLPEQGPIEEAAGLMARGYADKALEVIDGALAKTPEDYELHYARGVALQGLGRGEEAVTSWRSCLDRKPGFFPALNGIGAVELDAGNLDAAVEALQGAIEAKPDFPDAHYNLGLALRAKGELDAALTAFVRAKELNPGDADIYTMLAALHLRRDELAQARTAIESARELRGEDPEVMTIEAKILTAEGKHGEAAKVYEALVAASPEDAESRLQLARALVRSGRAAEALPILAALAEQLPEEAVVLSEWAGALLEAGQIEGPEGAMARIERALELKPGLVSARVREIMALSAKRSCKKAEAAHRELVAAEPKAKAQADEALRACTSKR